MTQEIGYEPDSHEDVRSLASLNEVVAEVLTLTGPEHAARVRALTEQARRVPAVYRGQEHRTYRHELIEMRKRRELRHDEVAAAMDWSLSKIIRIEVGMVGISSSDMRCLAAFYEVDPATTRRLVDQARTARARSRRPSAPSIR